MDRYDGWHFVLNGESFHLRTKLGTKLLVWDPIFEKCFYCGKIWVKKFKMCQHLLTEHNATYEDEIRDFCPLNYDNVLKEFEIAKQIAKEKHIKEKGEKISEANKIRYASLTSEEKQKLAKKASEANQGVFTLEWFIKKYGENGSKLYEERSQRISEQGQHKNYIYLRNEHQFSKVSQVLFNIICKKIGRTNGIYYGSLNHEFSLGSHHNFDFVDTINKKVIEFNGDKWHANPRFYKPNDVSIKKGNVTIIAKEVWEKDKQIENLAKSKGYDILFVWEYDFIHTPDKVIEECLKFLGD